MMGCAVAVSLVLTGCGGTPCDDLSDGWDAAQHKSAPCSEPGEQPELFDLDQCNGNLAKCSSADQEFLASYSDCLRALPECAPDTRQSFSHALVECTITMYEGLGEDCRSVLFSE
jgi:hypothetical protein